MTDAQLEADDETLEKFAARLDIAPGGGVPLSLVNQLSTDQLLDIRNTLDHYKLSPAARDDLARNIDYVLSFR